MTLLCIALAGCIVADPQPSDPAVRRSIPTFADRPDDAPAESCWGLEVRAAEVETVSDEVVLEPPGLAADGTLRTEPLTRTETRERVVRPREERWFEVPCPGAMTAARLATLQRALAARGHHEGPITGEMDAATERAIRAYQAPRGLESGTLSLAAARQLGVLPVPRPEA